MLKTFLIVAGFAASTAAFVPTAFAQGQSGGDHLTDGQYLAAVRCRALIASPALGRGDTSAIDTMIKTESAGRSPALLDRADEVKSDASRQAGHAGSNQKSQLMAERSGVCETLAGGGATTTAAQTSQPAGAN